MPHTIRLGLTFNGGVSLAVFQAGVAWELIRAVQFSRALTDNNLAPLLHADEIALPPGVRVPRLTVDVVTGTSSGGMAAAQLALALGGINAEAVLARMATTWISEADFARLIPQRDCAEQGLLTAAPSRELMTKLLDAANQRPADTDLARDQLKLEHDLDCWLTLTNFNGLREPVVLREAGTSPRAPLARRSFPTTRHLEYERIDDDDIGEAGERARIIDAVLATASFPVAFEPICRPSSAIEESGPEGQRTRFAYIDGGVVDNQPLTVAVDALAERPAPDRRLFFIDPRVVWSRPDYGEGQSSSRDDPPAAAPPRPAAAPDPLTIYQRLGDISRTDSIHHDLERLRHIEDQQVVLEALRERLLADDTFRALLVGIWPLVAARRFHPGAWGLWTLLGGDEDGEAAEALVDAPVRTAWARVAARERFPLPARLVEYLKHIGLPDDHPALALSGETERWRAWYRALARLRDLDRRFRQLRYEVWTRHLKRERTEMLPAAQQSAIVEAFEELARRADRLDAEQARLLDAIAALLYPAAPAGSPTADPNGSRRADPRRAFIAAFTDYARAMQVLEALTGIAWAPALRVRRITPFDLYDDQAPRHELRPLAGGHLGAFGGFLDANWRGNDLLVGRLVMRRRLRDEGLIPTAAFDAFVAWSAARDRALLARLPTDSVERMVLARFLDGLPPAPPYADDAKKPECLLRPEAMDLDRLPAGRLARHAPALAASVKRLRRRNQTRLPYRLLRPLEAPLDSAGLLLRLVTRLGGGRNADALLVADLRRHLRRVAPLAWLLLVAPPLLLGALMFVLGTLIGYLLGRG